MRKPWIEILMSVWTLTGVASAAERPVTGSPGSLERIDRVAKRCPTFHWGAVEAALAFELAVLALPEAGESLGTVGLERVSPETVRPLLEQSLPGSLRAWTPSLDDCLEAGGQYAWFVRVIDEVGAGEWSPARLFEVAIGSSSESSDSSGDVGPRRRPSVVARSPGAMSRERAVVRRPSRASAVALATPDAVALRGDVGDGGSQGARAIGLYGLSASAAFGSAGVAGESTALSGATSGVVGVVHSSGGAGGAFDNAAGGQVLGGRSGGVELFGVDGAGVVSAAAFVGDGSGLSGLEAATLEGQPASFYRDWTNLANLPPGFGVDGAGGLTASSLVGDGSGLSGADSSALEGQPGSFYLDWGNLTNLPVGFSVGGTGVVTAPSFVGDGSGLSGVDAITLEGLSGAVYRDWGGLFGVPPGFADGIDHDAGGDITAVLAGPGLAGGGASGDVTLEVDFAQTQARVVASCLPGQAIEALLADGSVRCGAVERSTTITIVDGPQNVAGEFSSIAIGAEGLPVIGYYDATAGALKVAWCNDLLCAGGDETLTTVDDSADEVGQYASIAVGTDGLPVIAYQDATNGSLKVAHCNDPACAGGDEQISIVDDPPVNLVGSHVSLAIGADGLPVVGYHDFTAAALKVAKCNDLACAGGDESISTVDDPPGVASAGLRTSLAIGADGLPVISYRHSVLSSIELRVAKCTDPACDPAVNGPEILSTVDPSNAGWFTSIAVGADGLPVISYYENTNKSLKVAKCNDPACDPAVGGPETLSTVDDPVDVVGEYSSIVLGADGLPVISYRNFSTGNLQVAKCNDPACAGGDETLATVDGTANVIDLQTSIVLGADGLPIISYHDRSAGLLKVAKCVNPGCQ